jgi:hypothetical protein
MQLGTVEHAYNSSIRKWRKEGSGFKASLSYRERPHLKKSRVEDVAQW